MADKLRRLVPGLLAAGLVLSACGSGGGEDNRGAGGGRQPASGITVSMITWGGSVPDNDVIGPALKDATGIEVELRGVAAQEEYYQQLGADLAAGSTADLVEVDRGHLQTYVDQGLVADLSDHMDDLTDYTNYVGDDIMALGTIEDTVYGLPKKPAPGPNETYWIRKDWLDNLGLETPETVQDFEEVLRAFTEDDPDGNGKDDTYGLTGGGMNAFAPIFGAFGVGFPVGFYEQDGEIVSGYAADGTKEALDYMRGLVTGGYTDPDNFSLQPQPALDRALDGVAGVVHAAFTNIRNSEAALGGASKGEWVQLAAPSGPGGGPMVVWDTGRSAMFAIPASVDDAKIAAIVEVLNYVSSEDGQNLVMYGIEGTDWEQVDGKPQLTEAAAAKTDPERGLSWMYQLSGRVEADFYSRGGEPWSPEEVEFTFGQPTIRNYASQVTAPEGYQAGDATRFAQENLVQFISGQKPIDEYNAFVDELYSTFGYQALADAAAAQVDLSAS